MRVNTPVIDREVPFPEGTSLVSKTNLKGVITFANQAFIDISGYSESELIGQAHNLVRHPDMPQEAFLDLWNTVNAGRPWSGVVKNRCKNGEYYWVNARVIPVYEGRAITEYMSVRKKASREEIASAESLYRDMNAGKIAKESAFTGFKNKVYQVSLKAKSHALIGFMGFFLLAAGLSNLALAYTSNLFLAALAVCFSVVALSVHRLLTHTIPADIDRVNDVLQRVVDSSFDVSLVINRDDEIGGLMRTAHILQTKVEYDLDHIKALMGNAIKLKNTLDVCNANVMLADNDMNISYLNAAAAKMFGDSETDLKEVLPDFNAGELMGENVDIFHKDPSHQRHMIEALKDTYKTTIKVGIRSFTLIANPVLHNNGERLGTVVEWEDITAELERTRLEKIEADNNARMKNTLDVCAANVMLADTDMNIIYMNDTVKSMFNEAEADLKEALPNFDAKELMGKNVDIFHKDPSHQRHIVEALKETYSTTIKAGVRSFTLVANPVLNDLGERLGTVVEWEDISAELERIRQEKIISDTNARMKITLDSVTSSVMVADNDLNIIYMNGAADSLMRGVESDLKKDLTAFNADKLIGVNIDVFHKNPSHQRGMLANLSSTHNASFVVGGRTMAFTANPVFNDEGERIGTAVEWEDRTAEVAIEKEIDNVVSSAAKGDLSQRISMVGKEGFFAALGEGLNALVQTSEEVISDTNKVLGALASGNLTHTISAEYEGSFGSLKSSANTTVENLTKIITQVRAATNSISSGADEIARGNADLSQRTEEQASSLEETASSMEEMTTVVKQSAENASSAGQLSEDTLEIAVSGGEVVSHAVSSMTEILSSSRKIADIIGVIDEIAFQTNLLALNAAVEAARAGEQGRGFAVVASEVRNLSQRSANAAKEIKELIQESVAQVERGVDLVNKTGDTLENIVGSVERVNDSSKDISTAAAEQTSGISQINIAINQMDEMTQQNAALVEQASAASENVADQAVKMRELMDFFTLMGGMDSTASVSMASMGNKHSAGQASQPSSMDIGNGDEWEEF